MVIDDLLDRDVPVALHTQNKPHLPRQSHRVLAPTVTRERVQVEGSDAVEVLEAFGLKQGGDTLDISPTHFRPPGADGIGPVLVSLLQPTAAKLNVHVSPHD